MEYRRAFLQLRIDLADALTMRFNQRHTNYDPRFAYLTLLPLCEVRAFGEELVGFKAILAQTSIKNEGFYYRMHTALQDKIKVYSIVAMMAARRTNSHDNVEYR